MKYDLAIAHRVCPILARTASHFTNKFEMVKATTISLANALKGIKVKLVVIFDGCPLEYERLFHQTFGEGNMPNVDYSHVVTQSIGNSATYARQLEILSTATSEAQFLYFSEDDYIYQGSAFGAMMDFLHEEGVDFVTPLDHPDGYQRDREGALAGLVRVTNMCHWREVSSTCCTFMLKSLTMPRAFKSLTYYANGGSDYIMGLLLTKKGVFSPRAVIGGAVQYAIGKPRNWMSCIPLSAWLKLGPRLFFSPRFHLWSPMPTLAVHLCIPSLPPLAEPILKSNHVHLS